MGKCNHCKRNMKDSWNYCPNCGAYVDKPLTMGNILRKQMDILRVLMSGVDSGEEMAPPRPMGGITIRIDSRGMNQPNIQVFPKPVAAGHPNDYQMKKPPERKLPDNIIEPEVKVKRLAKEMTFTIPLPDVKSPNDVELSRFSDSMEVRAFANDMGYFKILNIPSNHRLIEKTFSDGNLNLKFAI